MPTPTHMALDHRHASRMTARLAAVLALLVAFVVAVPSSSDAATTPPPLAWDATLVEDAAFTSGGLQQPSIIRAADHFDDPLGAYYLYYGTQHEGGIGLAYGDSPTGPFTPYAGNPVVSSVSGPHALYDEDSDQLLLYLHGTQNVAVSRSTDGINFSTPEALLNGDDYGISRLQLPRVFEHTLPSVGNRYTMLVMGIDDGVRKVYLATSDDGHDWTPRAEPVVSPGPGEGGQIASPHLLEWDGQTHVAYHASSGNIHWTRTGPDFDVEEHLGVLHAPLDVPPDSGRVAAPAFIEVDGDLAMVYEAGPSSEAVIAIATADGSGDPGDPTDPPVDPPPFPTFTHRGVAFDKADQEYNPTDEFIFPSIIRAADHFDDPLGEYYLYYAPHDPPGGIALQYSDSLDGPWTEYEGNPIISNSWPPHYDHVSHVSSPHAVFNNQEGKLFLYYHGENTVTRYATSDDGVSFDYGGEALTVEDIPGNSESSYARVFEHTIPGLDNTWIMLLMGNESGTRKIWLAWSDDGRDWTARTTPVVSPSTGESGQLSGPWFFPWQDRYFVVHHSGSGTIHATEVGAAFDREYHHGVFYESSTGRRAAAPSFITEGHTMYMFHELGHRLNADIGWATADISDFLPPDDVAPEVSLTVTPDANGSGWHDDDVTVAVAASDDGGSGVETIEWRVAGATERDGTIAGDTGEIVVSAEGATTVTAHAVDAARNVGDAVEVTVRIDGTAPTVACPVDPDVVWPPDRTMVDVVGEVAVQDALSGPAGFVLLSVTTDQGDVTDDTDEFTVGTADMDGSVRAWRDPDVGDRHYDLAWIAADVAGNTARCHTTVTVPVHP